MRRKNRALVLGTIFALAALFAVGCRARASRPSPADLRGRPDILLVSIDTLRADRLGCYGAKRPTSPNLDALAAEGAHFTRALANAPWTLPSHVTMLTGLEVGVHGVGESTMALTENASTIAKTLNERGYRTAAVVTAPYLRKSYGFGRGFERYDERLATEDFAASHNTKVADRAVEQTLRAIREWRGDRWFVFLHIFDVHHDFLPPPPYHRLFVEPGYRGNFNMHNWEGNVRFRPGIDPADYNYVLAQYDGGVAWVDHCLGRLFAGLRVSEDWANMAVVVTADHGDEFLDHRQHGHGHTLFNELLNVPLIVKAPGVARATTVACPVGLFDLYPTLAEWAGADLTQYQGPGRSLLPLLRGANACDRSREFCAETTMSNIDMLREYKRGREFSIEKDGWKYIERIDPPLRELLFHTVADPTERDDLRDSQPEKAAEMKALLANHRQRNGQQNAALKLSKNQPLDDVTAQRLKQLGYIK